MKTRISGSTNVLVVSLLCIVCVTTFTAQEKPNLVDYEALAARGVVLANEDPLALELRSQYSNSSWQRGIDIGMAAAEGHTAPGPGKDRICASLPARELRACGSAVSFSVERNRNAAFAFEGAAIAMSDPAATAMLNAARNVFYKLGFHIGLAAAGGDTLPGPGKDRIRDSLLPSLREGFSEAVSYMLERNRNNSALGATDGTTAGPAEKAASNEIRCRGFSRPGGGNYVFFTIDSRPSSTGETIVTYEIAFRTSWKAAGLRGEGLDPGECAWVDRPIGNAGPFRLRFETVANAQLRQQLRGDPVDRSSTAAESYPDVNTIPIYLKGEDHYWSFGGISNAGSYFVATGNGYWKPGVAIGDVDRSPTEPIRAQDRMRRPDATSRTPLSICEAARQARARNSPAAPGLEEKCRVAGAAGEVAPIKPQGRVRPDPEAAPPTPSSICEKARQARARNSPAAPGLEAKCRAAGAAGEVPQ